MATNPTTAHDRYEALVTTRDPFLQRARQAAEVTIPALMPPEGHSGTSELLTPWQSIGARGVNNLAAKLLLALFPPGTGFFRLSIDDFALRDAGAEGERAAFESALASVVRAVTSRMEQVGSRPTHYEALRQLIACGNVLVYMGEKGKPRLHFLDEYCVKRDGEGNVLEIVVKEMLDRASLPLELRALIDANADKFEEPSGDGRKTVELYTWVRMMDGKWKVSQELGTAGVPVPEADGTYPKDRTPWLPLRMTKIDGEDYGRGFVEEYLGDLLSLESLQKSLVQYAAVAARVLMFVDPGGVTNADEVADAPSGEVLDGDAKDITLLTLDKFNDFGTAWQVAQALEKRLENAFLLITSVQRAGERVTAEEIRRLADELEQALGGVYSILAEEYQRPLVRVIMSMMAKSDDLPQLPEDEVNLEVVTGVDALGRNQDLMKLDLLIQGLVEVGGPQAVAEYLNLGDYIQRRAAALSIDTKGLVRSDEEVQQARQAAQQQAMAERAIGPAINAATQGGGDGQR
jgi:hypothetical protein